MKIPMGQKIEILDTTDKQGLPYHTIFAFGIVLGVDSV